MGHAVYYIMLFNLHKYFYKYLTHQQYCEITKIYVGQIDTTFVANLFRIIINDTFLGACAKLAICLAVRLSDRMEQLDSYRTDFHEIRCLSIVPKSVQKI